MLSTSRTRWFLIVACAALFHGLALRHWALKDTRPLAWDQATHTEIAFGYQDRFAVDGFARLLRPVSFNYPPLYHLGLIPVLGIVKDIADAGALVNFFYLCVLMLAVFLIGDHLMGPWEGGTAALLVGCYPILIDLLHETLIDFSLTAWVALSFLCLIKSDDFKKPLWSALFGVVFGGAMLTKWTAPGYLVGPLIVVLWRTAKIRKFAGLGIALAMGALVIFSWYIVNFIPMLSGIHHISGLPPASGQHMAGWVNIFWYPIALIEQLNLLFLLLLLPGLLVVFWRPKMMPVFLWFVVSLFLFSLINNKNTRYTAPALPAASLLSVAWLPSARRIPFLLVGFVAASFFLVTYYFPVTCAAGQWGSQPIWIIQARPPVSADWKHDSVIDKIRVLKAQKSEIAHVTVVSNSAHFHSTTLNVTTRAKNIADVAFKGVGKKRWFEFSDFVLLKTGDIGPIMTGQNVRDCAEFLRKPPEWFTQTFKEVDRWLLPDQSEAVLYQCRPDAQNIPDIGIFNLSLNVLELPNIYATGVEVTAVPLSSADTQIGRLKELRIRCKTVDYKNIRFSDVDIRLVRPEINVPFFFKTHEIQLNSLKGLEPHATISRDTLLAYAAKKAKWLKDPKISFDGTVVRISGTAGVIPLELAADVRIENNQLKTHLLKMKISHIPFPLVMVRALTDRTVDLKINKDRAYDLMIGQIEGNGPQMRLGL